MADEHILQIETHLPITFTKSTAEALEKGAMCEMTNTMTATISNGDTDIVAGVVHTEVTAAEASPSVSIYRGGIFSAVAGVAGVTFGKALITDSATSSANRLVDADVGSENIVGTCLQTAGSGSRFFYELNPFAVNLA